MLEQRLAEHDKKLQQMTAREDLLAAQNADLELRLDEALKETASREGALAAAHAQLAENSVALAKGSQVLEQRLAEHDKKLQQMSCKRRPAGRAERGPGASPRRGVEGNRRS